MTKRIQEDHKRFRGVVSGHTRRELKRLIKTGTIVRLRPKGGKITISVPRIDLPHFLHGDNGEGVGRGEGKEGDIIDRDPQKGQGSGAGQGEGEGIHIQVDMEDVLKFMEEELKLPHMKPKPNETFQEIRVKYNDISRVGLNSLRHTRRTMKEALKRLAMTGKLDKLEKVAGADIPMKVVTPIKADFRYRQYTEEKIPSANAVIFFARDCSASMDDFRCDIVSDMAWWMECWIKKFYKQVDRCYYVHDTRAQEVTEEEFYTYRFGGGTQCSSAFEIISQQLENRYPPEKYNIYVFYFTDGDNWPGDNEKMSEIIQNKLGPGVVNLVGITQVCPWSSKDTVQDFVEKQIEEGILDVDQVRTAAIEPPPGSGSSGGPPLSDDSRNEQIIQAIRDLLSD